ncbi:MAG: hypothetical protein ACSLFE_09675 [Gemmatimonadaceae bacterium]
MERRPSLAHALLTVMALSTPVAAQEDAHAHAAAERLGTVIFETSCLPEVAPAFNRAVALLHSFEFGESIRAFHDVLARDSTCAMAYWGLALSHWNNPMAPGNRATILLQRGSAAAQAGMRLSGAATQREGDYIAAVGRLFADYETRDQQTRVDAYEAAMGELVAKYPDDIEARIFHALSVAASAPLTDKSYVKQLRAGEILESIFAARPDHPGVAHYIIHSYDFPVLAGKAATAARQYAEIAPSAAHALHMPSHTFTRVGLWDESVSTNLRSIDAARTAGSWSEVLHAADYAVYAYLQRRHSSAAETILAQLRTIAAQFDVNAVTGAAPGWAGVFALAAIPARYALERHAWSDAAALQLTRDRIPQTDALTYFARALGSVNTGDLAGAREAIDSLAVLNARLTERGEAYWAEQVAIQHGGAQAWVNFANGRTEQALKGMRETADREDATEKAAVTPGPLAPARELLGDMLIRLNRPAEALAEYRAAQEREPNRYWSLHGAMKAAAAVGDRAAESEYARQIARLTATSSQGCIAATRTCRVGVRRDQSSSRGDSTRAAPQATPAAVAVPPVKPEKTTTASPVDAAQRGYHRDSSGRCYTFNSQGRRVQVDPRLCQ